MRRSPPRHDSRCTAAAGPTPSTGCATLSPRATSNLARPSCCRVRRRTMVSIDVTGDEVASGVMTAEHVAVAVEALRTDGFVIVNDIVDPAHLDVLHERMLSDLVELQQRPDAPYNWHAGNVQQDPPPFPPYLFRDVLVNDMVICITKAVLGPGIKNVMYGGNNALPSDRRQPVHVDTGHLWPANVMECAHPPAQLVINMLTVDVSPANGSTEIWPGTHRDV